MSEFIWASAQSVIGALIILFVIRFLFSFLRSMLFYESR